MEEKLKKDDSLVNEPPYASELLPFLPSSQEIMNMSLEDFSDWVDEAYSTIPQRKIARNPLAHLQKNISLILKASNLPEEEKEERVYKCIDSFQRYTY
ncbi:hypothetical protein ACWE42_16680 [Sutcliffiella cohnii]